MIAALVMAGGAGARFGVPKQFLEIAPGLRLVDHVVDIARSLADFVVLVLPSGREWDGQPVSAVAAGGATRLESVSNGLRCLPADAEVVLVHDAAHPLASCALAQKLLAAIAAGADCAYPLLGLADVVKRKRADGTVETVGRDELGLCQVPHAFRRETLEAIHARPADVSVYEDSELVERAGGRVETVPGEATNIHVVTSEDLWIVRTLFRELGSAH